MGTKIIETGSTAGGIAKVEYKDEAGNVLWYYDDAGNFVRNGNAKITGLAGTGNRMVVADASGNLSANNKFVTSYNEGVIPGVQNSTWVVLMECPVGKIDIAVSVDSFATTTVYYSQASFARGSNGKPVEIYIANCSNIMSGTDIRLNENNIEARQRSGAVNPILYRYSITNTKI